MLDNYDYKEHWNNAYQNNVVEKLGWFEDDPVASIDLIEKCNLSKDALIFNAGAGATTLITLYDNLEVDIIANKTFTIDLDSQNEYNNYDFINNTNMDLVLYNYSDDEYLGQVIIASSSETLHLSLMIDLMVVIVVVSGIFIEYIVSVCL